MSRKPWKWGLGVLIINKNDISYRAGFERNATNNRMELMAAIKALEFLDQHNDINLNTDSNYVKQGITNWIFNWKKNNWKTSSKKPVKNKELWERLDELNLSKNINWIWVKAHNIDEFNNQVDILARKAAENLTESSFN
tara:strand:- start:37 stop:453 length:417 start_codon:yes stop_codon:yes gene_type:complete